ncbi:5-formyltetrahydrofolate cyclo-ligase [Cellulosimicrobium sp. CUA-896]|uniref:5-formyltetrahydrofolate cyclo-ligase n=1 Tax=Cellulosimicrobium sp. CUA-896 TaxID=1517881 RepID=UPI00351965E4
MADVVETIPEVGAAACVATYAARPSEPGTLDVLERLAARGARVLLPVLGAGLQRDWAEYAGPSDLQVRAPGRPPEPGTPPLGPEALAHADVVIAPALAVDTRGVRLGQGGGWYDRALEHTRPGTKVVAVVFPEEVYDAADRPLPVQPHDRPVDAVATPLGWRWLP